MVAPKAVYGKEICDKIILLSPRCGCKWSRLGKYCKRFRVTVQRLAAPGLLAPGCGRQVPVSKLAPVNHKENTAFGPEKKSYLTESLEGFRERLSHSDALPQLVSLGVISGILAALVIMPVAIDLKFFVLLGMVAMTGAVLNAAMTALVATPELSPYLE